MKFNVNREVVNMLETIADRPELQRIIWAFLGYLMLREVPDVIDALAAAFIDLTP